MEGVVMNATQVEALCGGHLNLVEDAQLLSRPKFAQEIIINLLGGENDMINEGKVTDDITISGQPSVDELRRLRDEGYRTVINLRTPGELGELSDEERIVEESGLNYASIPVSPQTLDDMAVERFTNTIASEGRTPVLVHCKSRGRAGMLALLHLAIQNGWSLQQTLEEGKNRGNIAPPEGSPYRQFFESFIHRHSAGER
jgi:uncharacterized protein (TIGR01244 family)